MDADSGLVHTVTTTAASMIGLIAIIVLGFLLLTALWLYGKVRSSQLAKGKSAAAARAWGVVAMLVATLPITWDAIPTWIAFEYYARTQAGITVFKTVEQWKQENPGVVETLEPYGVSYSDRRMQSVDLPDGRVRMMLNSRIAYETKITKVFLSVRVSSRGIVDTRTDQMLVQWIGVGAGSAGGLVSGGAGWWKPWLRHSSSTDADRSMFDRFQSDFHYLRNV